MDAKHIKAKEIYFNETGDPSVLKERIVELQAPKGVEVLIKHTAVGVNFVETYYRSGLYQTPLPSKLGTEASGVVVAIGENVQNVKVGDRVCYATGPLGSYSTHRIMPSEFLVKIPEGVSDEEACLVILKGLTVSYLFEDIAKLEKGMKVLFHASSGGVGLIACQWAKHLGVELIGTTSSDEKAQVSESFGARHVINYKKEKISQRVFEITSGEKVDVVFDGIGRDTWFESLDSLKERGLMVSFGNASGDVVDVKLSDLSKRGSLFVTRPTLIHYVKDNEALNKRAKRVFDLVLQKKIIVKADKTFALGEASLAHQELLNRDRVGGLLITFGT